MTRILASLLLALAVTTGTASAHAMLTRAAPAVGSTGPTPQQITMEFSESIEPTFSHVELRNAANQPVPLGPLVIVPGQPTRLGVAVRPLPPGAYKVIWHVTSTDTHKTQGSFGFTIAP